MTKYAPSPDPVFTALQLTSNTIAAALNVADRCFLNEADRSFLRGHWTRVLEGRVSYFCSDDCDYLTLLDHFVYIVSGEVIAFGGLYRHDSQPESAWLNWFGVDPAHRGNGYGNMLINHLAQIAKRRGAMMLVGYTEDSDDNIGTKRFYESLHFKPSTLYYFRGEEVRLFKRKLV